VIVEKSTEDSNEFLQYYLFEKYLNIIINESKVTYYNLIDTIYDKLNSRNNFSWEQILIKNIKELPKNNDWYINFATRLGLETEQKKYSEEINLDGINLEEINLENEELPF
jgi:hypothetical protein